MGPCPKCGQPTETDASFCPACGGYAAPATVYAYAPGRLEQSRDEAPAPRLGGLPAQAGATARPAILPPATKPPATKPPATTPDTELSGTQLAATLQPAARLDALEPRFDTRRSGRRIAMAATLAVVLIATVTVGVVLASHRAVSSHPRATGSSASRASSPVPGTAARSAPPARATGLVRVAPPAAHSPYLVVVLPFLNSYFTAINRHDYAAYESLFSPVVGQSAAAFSAGYGTTTDSAVALQSVGVIGDGELVAQVSFVSHQQPAASPTGSSCNVWTISLYLLWQDSNYLLQQPPPGYQPSDAACS